MLHRTSILTLVVCAFLLASCSAPVAEVPIVVPTSTLATIKIPASATPTALPSLTDTPALENTSSVEPAAISGNPGTNPFPLGDSGPYSVGRRTHKFDQEIRKGQKVSVTIWYPAQKLEGATGDFTEDAPPDLSASPYPLLMSSTEMANIFAPHLASHGFAVVGINNQWTYLTWDVPMIEYPQETLLVLDELANAALPGLEGLLDAENAGYFGYSFDGTNAFFLSGARVDPQFYLEECAKFSRNEATIPSWSPEHICALTDIWEEFVAHAGEAAANPEDGLWQPYTDARIRVVMPMAGEGAWLFGDRGLAAVQVPILMIIGSKDEYSLEESEYILQHLGSPERAMIVFDGETHKTMFEGEAFTRWKHFITAFFGHQLQGQADYAQYYSEEFVNQHNNLTIKEITEP